MCILHIEKKKINWSRTRLESRVFIILLFYIINSKLKCSVQWNLLVLLQGSQLCLKEKKMFKWWYLNAIYIGGYCRIITAFVLICRHNKTPVERGGSLKPAPASVSRDTRQSPNVSMDASFAFCKDSVADDFGEEMMAWIDKEGTAQSPSFVWPMKIVVIYVDRNKIFNDYLLKVFSYAPWNRGSSLVDEFWSALLPKKAFDISSYKVVGVVYITWCLI